MPVPVATVDVRQLNTLNWGPIRAMFPAFVDEMELARYLRRVLADAQCRAVRIQPHCDASGVASTHIYDVIYVSEADRAD
jgi:hypothetical protein